MQERHLRWSNAPVGLGRGIRYSKLTQDTGGTGQLIARLTNDEIDVAM